MPSSERRGLGRGLGAIIRDTGVPDPLPVELGELADPPQPADRALIARLAGIGLDLLEDGDPSVLGYLHIASDADVQVLLRRPALADTDPTTAYQLLAALDRATGDLGRVRQHRIGATTVSVVPSRGRWSVGVHLLGWERPPPEGERRRIEGRARAVAQLAHQLHEPLERDEVVTVKVDEAGGASTARAIVTTGAERREAEARGHDVPAVVARAVIAAHGGAQHRATRSLPLRDGRVAILTVAATPIGDTAVGFCVADAAPVDVAVAAARRALGL